MSHVIANLAPSVAQWTGLAALAVVCIAYAMLGGAAAGRNRLPEADLICGWAVAASAVTLLGAVGVPVSWIDHALLALGVGGAVLLWRRERELSHPGWGRVVVLALPMVVLVTAMQASQWDEFTHWLPNARYLFEVNAFPSHAGPPSPSVLPAYPHGLAIPMAYASTLAGHFVDNAGALFNVALLMGFALLIARLIALGAHGTGEDRNAPGWGMSALALLAVTVLSPTFVPKIAFTAYADLGTAICVAFASVLLVFALGALGAGADARARTLAWQAGLAFTILVSLKQVNVVLGLGVLLGIAIAAWRDPTVSLARLLALAPRVLVLPAVVYVAWRAYVAMEVTGGEFSLRPFAEWFIPLIPTIVTRMLVVLSHKGGYFALALIAIAIGIRALRRVETPLDRLSIVTATVFLGYNAFLLLTYVAAFGENDALTVGSFWRYNMHVGGLTLTVAALGGGLLWRRWTAGRRVPTRALGVLAVALMVAWPIAGSTKLRFDIRPPKLYVRAVAAEIRPLLKPGDRLALIDDSGFGTFAMMMRYELLYRPAEVSALMVSPDVKEDTIREFVARQHPDYAWIHVPTPAIEKALGVTLAPRASYLLRKDGAAWHQVKSWPYPGYDLPEDWK